MTLQGKIRTYIDDKGFGFIRPADGHHDIFFHASQFFPKGTVPSVGMSVSYGEGVDDRTGKSKAVNVTLIDAPPSTAKPQVAPRFGNDPWRG